MGNVLSEMFQDQANAIREGLGDIGKLPPLEFAGRIREIVALIGTGGESGGESGGTGGEIGSGFKVTTGTFDGPEQERLLEIPSDALTEGVCVYEVSPAVLELSRGDKYSFQYENDSYNAPSSGAVHWPVLGTYSNFYGYGNPHLIDADYDTAGNGGVLNFAPFFLIYDEAHDKNIVVVSVRSPYDEMFFFDPESLTGTRSVAHGLGTMPDFICVYQLGAVTGIPNGTIVSAWGTKTDFKDYFGDRLGAVQYNTYGNIGWPIEYGIDEPANVPNGGIRCSGNTTFSVGNGDYPFAPSPNKYGWFAISGLGSSGGGTIEGVDPYYQQLAETAMTRNAVHLGDETTLNLKSFKLAGGGTMGQLARYSFAGFDYVEGMAFTDVLFVLENAFRGNKKLKIIDITVSTSVPAVAILTGAMPECPALEAVVVRDGGAGITNVAVAADCSDNTGFYVYIPETFYEQVMEQVAINSNNIDASRYRKLEDYPQYEFWNETFTVEFYDKDTLLKTVEVKGGQSVVYNLEKDGMSFGGWDPEPTQVAKNMKCYAQWIPNPVFATASWNTISEVSRSGKASQYFKVGDTKTVTFADGTMVDLEIVAFDHDDLADGSGKAGITIMSKHVLTGSAYYNMHGTMNAKNIDWTSTELYARLNSGTIYANIPEGIKNVVRAVTKKTSKTGYRNTTSYSHSDKFWLPSVHEIGYTGTSPNFAYAQGTKYGPYPSFSNLKQAGASLRKTDRAGTVTGYWLRSPENSGSYSMFFIVSANLNGSYAMVVGVNAWEGTNQSPRPGIVLGFCV